MRHMRLLIPVFLLSAILSGCAAEREESSLPRTETEPVNLNQLKTQTEIQIETQTEMHIETQMETDAQNGTETTADSEEQNGASVETVPEAAKESAKEPADVPPVTMPRPDWGSYFGNLNGAAVLYDPDENTFQVYNEDLADTRRSPCSTFKIISSLVGLESGAIDRKDSTRPWSGEVFWNDDWNQDIDFPTAFRTSCVWYYRQVIDDIGPEGMQDALELLQYGNCDLSDWEGRLNNNNSNPALTGFWIESSLKISPREQTQVLERIFGQASEYPPDILAALEEVMFLPETGGESCSVYGKTGMGKSNGIVVDAWYTGFADVGRRVYFCVYLGETANQDVSSGAAREIAVSLIRDY